MFFKAQLGKGEEKKKTTIKSLLTHPLAGEVLSAQLCLSPQGGSCLPWLLWCSVIAEQFEDDGKYIIHGCIFLPSPLEGREA